MRSRGAEQAQPQAFEVPICGWVVKSEQLHPGQQLTGHGDDLVRTLVFLDGRDQPTRVSGYWKKPHDFRSYLHITDTDSI